VHRSAAEGRLERSDCESKFGDHAERIVASRPARRHDGRDGAPTCRRLPRSAGDASITDLHDAELGLPCGVEMRHSRDGPGMASSHRQRLLVELLVTKRLGPGPCGCSPREKNARPGFPERATSWSMTVGVGQKSIPPIPPPGGIGDFGSGFSATIASVVMSSPATDAASCSACRTTLVGSMMPALIMSVNSPFCAS